MGKCISCRDPNGIISVVYDVEVDDYCIWCFERLVFGFYDRDVVAVNWETEKGYVWTGDRWMEQGEEDS